MNFDNQRKSIKMMMDDLHSIENKHDDIRNQISDLKKRVSKLAQANGVSTDSGDVNVIETKKNTPKGAQIPEYSISQIFDEANKRYKRRVTDSDILTPEEQEETNNRIDYYICEFNRQYSLDGWDYAIAGVCGLIASLLDWFCIRAPIKPTKAFTEKVDGIFNRAVQSAFNYVLPPELSKKLSKLCPIGSADASIVKDCLFGAEGKTLSPLNHRIRELSHDPVLGIIFGVLDMLNNTTTVVNNGAVISYPNMKTNPSDCNIFYLIGKMFGHLCSDVNAPSANGNRGMGLPPPFMGLLRFFDQIKVGDSTFDKQLEYMYVKGYDFRHFVTTSIPCIIMEVLMRTFWIVKQHSLNNVPWGKAIVETLPSKINPRFRIMLTLGYGVMCGCNYGKIYISHEILNLNYSAWMGLAWNSFHSLKWALYDKQIAKWNFVELCEIKLLEKTIDKLEMLEREVEDLNV